MFTYFVDSDSDITPEIAKKYNYKLISMPYVVDGKEIYPYVDFKEFDAHKFYEMLRRGTLPSTCALSPMKYQEIFEEEFRKGNDIFYIHFSEAMSGTFNAMRIALTDLKEKYPDRKFLEIDTKGITTKYFIQAIEIGELLKKGKTPEEIIEMWKTEVDHYSLYFYADNLKFFAKSGRVSGLAAFFGGMIGIHPIIFMNKEGNMVTYGKCRGKKQTLEALVKRVEEIGDDIKNHPVIIGHTDCLEVAKLLEKMLKDKFGQDLKIDFLDVNPTAGSHVGPDGVGVAFHSNEA